MVNTYIDKPNLKCPYCNKDAKWCENKVIYGRNFGKSYMCWYCKPCDAYVGCHQNTFKPLGTIANKELRRWRMKAHEVIDPMWKNGLGRKMLRKKTYAMLKEKFGREIHIGESDIETCKKIIQVINPDNVSNENV